MPSLLRDVECSACGHRHHFCFIGDNLLADQEHEYVCPVSAKKTTLRPTSTGEVVLHTPQGAVALTPADTTHDKPSLGPRQPPAKNPEAVAGETSVSDLASIPQRLQRVEGEVRTLAARIDDLEQQARSASSRQPPAQAQPQTAGGP